MSIYKDTWRMCVRWELVTYCWTYGIKYWLPSAQGTPMTQYICYSYNNEKTSCVCMWTLNCYRLIKKHSHGFIWHEILCRPTEISSCTAWWIGWGSLITYPLWVKTLRTKLEQTLILPRYVNNEHYNDCKHYQNNMKKFRWIYQKETVPTNPEI